MKKNLCVVGFGGMGGWHVNHALESDVVNLKGIYDIDEKKRKAAQDRNIFAYDSFDAVLNDKDIDLLTIATPNDVHKELVIKALKAGKNVICEKPVALSCADFADMVAAAHESGKLFTTHQNRRWDVDFLARKTRRKRRNRQSFKYRIPYTRLKRYPERLERN